MTYVRAVLAAVIVLLGAVLAPQPAQASVGSDRFLAGKVYRGEFGAPSLLVIGKTYYAFATNTDGDNVPAMTSTDMRTWRARKAWPLSAGYSTWSGYNDSFPHPARWALYHQSKFSSTPRTGLWAPSVAKVGSHFVMAYAVPVPGRAGRHCISIATSRHALGAYVDHTTKPIVCSSDPMGSIDPQVLVTPANIPYLIWKNAGVPGSVPTKVWSRRLNASGTAFATPNRQHFLLQTKSAWEGNVIEAPAMQYYRGHWYLFYSGNRYVTSQYAVGYARCSGPMGPCHRPSARPLLASGGGVAGPGAASAIVDLAGQLRLGYSAWDAGHVGYPTSSACQQTSYGCNQRRLHIATLGVTRTGNLYVAARG
ncbi:MAG TPA: family 43 glycosylhydrolase [Jatrophihabitans sp.]|jgi:beta-xylosidase